MQEVGRIKSIWRYPVKSMAGELLIIAKLGWHGIEGDRRFAFMRTGNLSGFPWLNASKLPGLIRYKAYHTNGSDGSPAKIRVCTPGGADIPLESESLRQELVKAFGAEVVLNHLSNGTFDDAPVSVISTTTLQLIEKESGVDLDPRRFRPNILIEPINDTPVHEDEWVGKTVVLGMQANAPSVRVTVKDVRCVMVNLDPETAAADARVLKTIAHSRHNCAGVYASVFNVGMLHVGDQVYLKEA